MTGADIFLSFLVVVAVVGGMKIAANVTRPKRHYAPRTICEASREARLTGWHEDAPAYGTARTAAAYREREAERRYEQETIPQPIHAYYQQQASAWQRSNDLARIERWMETAGTEAPSPTRVGVDRGRE